MGIQIQAARALLSERHDTERALDALDRAQRIAGEGLVETRRAVQALRTDGRPLDEELADLADAHRAVHHVPVQVAIHGQSQDLAPDAALALLRTAQESLVNAAKHSPGQPVSIDLTHTPTGTDLQVSNPMRDTGAATSPSDMQTVDGGYGLLGMRERLLLLHGSLTASFRAGRWQVTARVPR